MEKLIIFAKVSRDLPVFGLRWKRNMHFAVFSGVLRYIAARLGR